jgi:Tfp pilus assembly protein PilO
MNLRTNWANAIVAGVLAVAALAVAFWLLALGPKRDEAAKLGDQARELKTSLAGHRSEVAAGLAARRQFPRDYQKLVVLGKAVPRDSETASLLVQVNRISKRARVRFDTLELEAGSGGSEESASTSTGGEGTSGEGEGGQVSATEAAASLLPLGATVGPAGLAVMPYTLTFEGSFFRIADFIKGLDGLVATNKEKVSVDGRLLTIDGFTLEGNPNTGFPSLEATFSVTTYLTPPSQGQTGGAGPQGPGSSGATPAATTTGAAR